MASVPSAAALAYLPSILLWLKSLLLIVKLLQLRGMHLELSGCARLLCGREPALGEGTTSSDSERLPTRRAECG